MVVNENYSGTGLSASLEHDLFSTPNASSIRIVCSQSATFAVFNQLAKRIVGTVVMATLTLDDVQRQKTIFDLGAGLILALNDAKFTSSNAEMHIHSKGRHTHYHKVPVTTEIADQTSDFYSLKKLVDRYQEGIDRAVNILAPYAGSQLMGSLRFEIGASLSVFRQAHRDVTRVLHIYSDLATALDQAGLSDLLGNNQHEQVLMDAILIPPTRIVHPRQSNSRIRCYPSQNGAAANSVARFQLADPNTGEALTEITKGYALIPSDSRRADTPATALLGASTQMQPRLPLLMATVSGLGDRFSKAVHGFICTSFKDAG